MYPRSSFIIKSKPGDAYWNRPGPWDDPNLDTLLAANKKWSQRVKQTAPEFFEGSS